MLQVGVSQTESTANSTGLLAPDAGTITFRGERLAGHTPRDAMAAGIAMIHQHFMLGGPLTVLDNILLGVEQSSRRWKWLPPMFRPIDHEAARKKLDQISAQYGLHVDWDAKIDILV